MDRQVNATSIIRAPQGPSLDLDHLNGSCHFTWVWRTGQVSPAW